MEKAVTDITWKDNKSSKMRRLLFGIPSNLIQRKPWSELTLIEQYERRRESIQSNMFISTVKNFIDFFQIPSFQWIPIIAIVLAFISMPAEIALIVSGAIFGIITTRKFM